MKNSFWLVLLVTVISSIQVSAKESDTSIELISFLNNFTIIGDSSKLTDFPLSVRVISIRDSTICYTEAKDCENQKLYIAVSEYDEEPAQAVYVSVLARLWKLESMAFNDEKQCAEVLLNKTSVNDSTSISYCINTDQVSVGNSELKKL